MNIAAGLLCCLLAAGSDSPVVLDRSVPELLTDRFDGELERTISLSWKNVGLRTILRRVSEDRKVAILLDRRIDPTKERNVEIRDRTLLAAIGEMAAQASADLSQIGHALYVGPPGSAAKLRTLVRLRSDELFEESSHASQGRQIELSRRRTLHWSDLDTPADLIRLIGERYRLDVADLDRIPHDLWAGATLPDVNACEALSLILIQFDLTFEWTKDAAGIRLVPIPDEVFLEKTYAPRGLSAEKAAQQWRAEISNLDAEPQGKRVLVRGTVEQHEAVESLMRPGRRTRDKKTQPTAPAPLSRRLFTLRTERAPAAGLFQELEKSGIIIRYDADALSAAGVNLDTPITLNVNKAPAEEFFQEVCEPLGLDFTIDHLTVTLTPK